MLADDTAVDVNMAGDEVIIEIDANETAAEIGDNENGLPFEEEEVEDLPPRTTFIDYLKSPIIGLLVGQGDEQALLTAHQALLTQSPWFEEACAKFSDAVSVSASAQLLIPLLMLLSNRSAELISLTRTSMPSDASSNTSTRAIISPKRSQAREI